MITVEIVRNHASMKVGDKLDTTDRWAAWAKIQGIAKDAAPETKKSKATKKPETTEE